MKNIVFIHGNSSSLRAIEPVTRLWENDAKIISFDLPGHGKEKWTGDYSWGTIKKFLTDKINKIKGDKLLLGNSVGGHYAIEIAPEIESLKGLVVFGAPPLKLPLNLEEAYAPNPYSGTFFKEFPESDELNNTLNGAIFNDDARNIIREDFLATDPKYRSTFLNDLTNSNDVLNEAEIFSSLKCSKYIISGKLDPTVNLDYLKQLQQETVSPFKLMEIGGCGHYPTLEKPEMFAKILGEICAEVFQ